MKLLGELFSCNRSDFLNVVLAPVTINTNAFKLGRCFQEESPVNESALDYIKKIKPLMSSVIGCAIYTLVLGETFPDAAKLMVIDELASFYSMLLGLSYIGWKHMVEYSLSKLKI